MSEIAPQSLALEVTCCRLEMITPETIYIDKLGVQTDACVSVSRYLILLNSR